jgi:hypothetical protein
MKELHERLDTVVGCILGRTGIFNDPYRRKLKEMVQAGTVTERDVENLEYARDIIWKVIDRVEARKKPMFEITA